MKSPTIGSVVSGSFLGEESEPVMIATIEGHGLYECHMSIADGRPIIRSRQTGKAWHANWLQLVGLAIEQGIDDQDSTDRLPVARQEAVR